MIIRILTDEFWYGSGVKYGMRMPLSARTEAKIDMRQNDTPNQMMPLLISTKGRIIWNEKGFLAEFHNGDITVTEGSRLEESKGGLREAYLCAMGQYFPFRKKMPAKELFQKVIYNTWIELTFFQNETDILHYAEQIIQSGMPQGVLMIDDGWSECYGDWRFHCGKFPNPKEMLAKLHHMGFEVMVWVCPFISADSVKYREAEKLDILIKNADGKVYIAEWWNGHSAVLDMSNPEAKAWLKKQLDALLKLGVNGFKFDAGDSIYYEKDNLTWGNVTPDEQSQLWAEFGEEYPFNEYRVTVRAGGYGLLQRLCDKHHAWGRDGVASLIPDTLLQGITGHPFGCPDMIGGGEYIHFQMMEHSALDEELFVRHAEIACLMPAMQFSAAPFRVLQKENFEKILKSIEVRRAYLPYMMEQLEGAAETGEPVVRYLAYEFPEEQAAEIIDQFMLGSKYLVAPIWEKGRNERQVYLPKGVWVREGERIESAGAWMEVSSRQGVPIIFERECL